MKKRSQPARAKGGRARRRRAAAVAAPIAARHPLWEWMEDDPAESLAGFFKDAARPHSPSAPAADAVHLVSPIAVRAEALPEPPTGCRIRSTLRPGDRMSIATPPDGPAVEPLHEGERVVGFDVRGAAGAGAYAALLESVEVIIPKADAAPGRRVLRWQLLDEEGRTLAAGEASFDLAAVAGELELELGIIRRRFVIGDYGALKPEPTPLFLP